MLLNLFFEAKDPLLCKDIFIEFLLLNRFIVLLFCLEILKALAVTAFGR